jgi:hypothetical protein
LNLNLIALNKNKSDIICDYYYLNNEYENNNNNNYIYANNDIDTVDINKNKDIIKNNEINIYYDNNNNNNSMSKKLNHEKLYCLLQNIKNRDYYILNIYISKFK